MLKLLRDTPSLRRFFAAFFQSQIGTGAAYVALLLVAYHRFHSGWAIALVLLGEFLPGIVLAPLFGSLADRISRRRLAVCADLLRALCFIALAIVPSFAATVALALLAGVGTALFRPAINAALPGMVPPERRSQLTAIFYASVNSGRDARSRARRRAPADHHRPRGAGAERGQLRRVGRVARWCRPCGLSAASRSGDEDGADEPASVWADTRTGARAAAAMAGVPVLIGVGALVVLTERCSTCSRRCSPRGPSTPAGSGYSVLMALYGLGMVAGSWTNARMGSDIEDLRRRWLFGIALSGLAMAVAALAPNFPLALMAFTLIGLGENLLVGPEMRLMQEMVAERLLGRVFGLKDVLENIAFVSAFLGAGALLSFAGVRAVFVGAGLVDDRARGGRCAGLPDAAGGRPCRRSRAGE